jgi:hypothetical protein
VGSGALIDFQFHGNDNAYTGVYPSVNGGVNGKSSFTSVYIEIIDNSCHSKIEKDIKGFSYQ